MIVSSNNKNANPKAIPMALGKKANLPKEELCSIAGMIKDQTLAAIITPLANPNNNFSILISNSSFIKKTQALPSAVPKKGIIKPKNNCINFSYTYYMIIKRLSN